MRCLPVVLFLFAASGCGDADESNPAETAASEETTAAAVVDPEIVVTEQTAGDRVAFVGRWREIDGKERVELFEDGRVTVAGGEMGFRGKYTVVDQSTIRVTLGGFGELMGAVTGKLSSAGDELTLTTELSSDSDKYRKIQPPSEGSSEVQQNSPEAVAAIEAAIREAANKPSGELTPADLAQVTKLDLSESEIADLKPLAGLAELVFLQLNGNGIRDLGPLAELTKLQGIMLDGNRVTDLKPLAGLTELTTLSLRNCKISDLTPLAGLTKMKVLGLTDNQITDAASLADMQTLVDLRLNGNQISDLKPLSGMTEMKLLQLDGNRITDLTPLATLIQTRFIELQDNPNLTVAEIEKLQKLLPRCKVNHNSTK
jgi:hypothetical protein